MFNSLKNIIPILLLVVSLLGLSGFNVAFADPGDFLGCDSAATDIGADDISLSPASLACVLTRLANIMILSVGAVFVVMIAYGGIKYSTALGDPKHLQNASQTWVYAVIGLFVVLAAYVIMKIVLGWLGVDFDPLDMTQNVGNGICQFLFSACIADPACEPPLPASCP